MTKSKFSDAQIMDALKRVEAGLKVRICAWSWASAWPRHVLHMAVMTQPNLHSSGCQGKGLSRGFHGQPLSAF